MLRANAILTGGFVPHQVVLAVENSGAVMENQLTVQRLWLDPQVDECNQKTSFSLLQQLNLCRR
jgi:hypothetical protein